jgi:hypothetical protein
MHCIEVFVGYKLCSLHVHIIKELTDGHSTAAFNWEQRYITRDTLTYNRIQ